MLRCLIIEDEPLAAEVLSEYIEMTPFLSLEANFPDAIQALEFLGKNAVDVLFLDINLPKINGMDFLKTLRRKPKVIITSAHGEYAVEGFDLQVTDYLLKPIAYHRFAQAVNKLLPQTPKQADKSIVRPHLFFTVNKRSVKIYLDDILFFESLKDAVSISTKHHTYVTHYQLGELEGIMQPGNFLRIHRSFLISVDKIESFNASEIQINGRSLPIGRSHKHEVMQRLGR